MNKNNNNNTIGDFVVSLNLTDFADRFSFINFDISKIIIKSYISKELIPSLSQKNHLIVKTDYLVEKDNCNIVEEINIFTQGELIKNNNTLLQAISLLWITKSSDCIFIPFLDFIEVRIKNPLLNTSIKIGNMDKKKYDQMLFNIKLSCNIDIFSKQVDSKAIYLKINQEDISCRCSIHPSEYGEALTLRLIYKINNNKEFYNNNKNIINSILEKKGLTIIAGPTCSGKTTFFYSLLQNLNDQHIITIEDPIEMQFSNMIQSDVENFKNYEEGIKSLLRQVPDIIGIGEIRDKQTMQSAIKAALTGHSVICTFHALTIQNVLNRILEMGCIYYENIIKNIICLNNFIPQYYEISENTFNKLGDSTCKN